MYTKGSTHDYFIEQYKQLHEGGYTQGYRISPTYGTRDTLKVLLEKYNCKSLFDFGCASAIHWIETDLQEYLGIEELYLYDPAIEKYNTYPAEQFDASFCIDVMEHIPEDSIDYIVNRVLDRTKKLAIFRIAICEASTLLPDGQNAHVTVQNSQWWRERIAQHKRDGIAIEVNKVVV